MNEILSYHGTLECDGNAIISGAIQVTLGGGELGQGFYLGDMAHEAFAWAKKKGARYKKPYAVEVRCSVHVCYRSLDRGASV